MDDKQRYQQYLLEKELAEQIRSASPEDRQSVIKKAYERLYREATWHPGLNPTEEQQKRKQQRKQSMFGWAIGNNKDVLEVGCGTGEFLASLAPCQKSCVGLEIAELKAEQFPDAGGSLSFEVMQGMSFPNIEDESFDVVFTSQVLEHFHPDDVGTHLREVYRVLRPGGKYVLDTPTGLNGPHDISRGFDAVATGMHLKEWTYTEIVPEFKNAGFGRSQVQILPQRVIRKWPGLASLGVCSAGWKVWGESIVHKISNEKLRTRVISAMGLYSLLLIGSK